VTTGITAISGVERQIHRAATADKTPEMPDNTLISRHKLTYQLPISETSTRMQLGSRLTPPTFLRDLE
jgi:hypothetical protein